MTRHNAIPLATRRPSCRLLFAAIVAASAPAVAAAAPVTIDVRGADGRPVADAVVTIDVPGQPPAGPRGPYAMEQKAIAFQPHVLVVPVGASVSFPNRDPVRHHVYSFSSPKRFDLKLYGREDRRSVTFDRPGVVALGCNIHDSMNGFVVVVATPFATKTDAAGRATFANVPPGTARLTVWSVSIRQSGNTLAQPIAVPPAGVAKTLTIGR